MGDPAGRPYLLLGRAGRRDLTPFLSRWERKGAGG